MPKTMMGKETAKLVRKVLKANYPGVKFSVTSKNAVRVKWVNGPSQAQVKKLLAPFEGKSFDGMDDSTHYHYSWLYPDGTVEWAKREESTPEGAEEVCFSEYLFTNRGYSRDYIEKDAAAYSVECGWPAPEIQWFKDGCQYIRDWEAEQESGEPIFRWFDEHLSEQTEYPEEETVEAVSSIVEVGHEVPEAEKPKAEEKQTICFECCFFQSARCPGCADMLGCDDFDNPDALEDLKVEAVPTVKKVIKKAIEPTIEPLDIGPMPSKHIENLHWTGQHVAYLLGDDWTYEGDPEQRCCDIMHKDGYGIHFWTNFKPKIEVSGNWPHLVNEFNKGGWTFRPNDKDKPTMGFSCGRDPAAVLRDIQRRFLPKYLEQYPLCVARCEETRQNGIRRLALLEKLTDVGGKRGSTYVDRVYFDVGGHSWATVEVDCYGKAKARELELPVGRETVVMEAIGHLFPAQSGDPDLEQLKNDQGAIKAALAILRGCSTSQRDVLTKAIESLEGSWNEAQEQERIYLSDGAWW